jgi:hypothetical protein
MNDDELRNAFDRRIARNSPAGADEVMGNAHGDLAVDDAGLGESPDRGWLRRPRLLAAAAAVVLVAGVAGIFAVGGNDGSEPVGVGTTGATATEPDQPATTDTSPATETTTTVAAFRNPFAECGDLWDGGAALDPVADEATLGELRELIQSQVMSDAANQVISLGHQNVYGRVSVGLAARNQNAIGMIDKIASPPTFDDDYVCVELPPADFDDSTPVAAEWVVAPESLPVGDNWQSLTLFVDDPDKSCGHNPDGRIVDTTVDYRDDEIEIVVLLEPVPYGAYTCEGWSPVLHQVALAEAPAGRPLVPGALQPIAEPELVDLQPVGPEDEP